MFTLSSARKLLPQLIIWINCLVFFQLCSIILETSHLQNGPYQQLAQNHYFMNGFLSHSFTNELPKVWLFHSASSQANLLIKFFGRDRSSFSWLITTHSVLQLISKTGILFLMMISPLHTCLIPNLYGINLCQNKSP